MDGLLVIDKPAGPTSHDVVARMRRALGERRIGHTGTLDPAATGVLPLVVGRATRLAQFLSGGDKSYEAVVRFGFATDTGDADGRPIARSGIAAVPSRDAVEEALGGFRGTFLQQPPAFSAKKIGGTRSHEIARARVRETANVVAGSASETVAAATLPAPVSVTMHRVEIVDAHADCVTLALVCSAGFYVRALAHDLGERLGVGAHLVALRRTRAGDFGLDAALPLEMAARDPAASAARMIAMVDMLPRLAPFTLSADGVRRAMNGCELSCRDAAAGDAPAALPDALVRLIDPEGRLLGIARGSRRPGILHPSVILM